MDDQPYVPGNLPAPDANKKKLDRALLSLADGDGTSEPHLAAILRTQQYNQAMGGAVFEPWELNRVPFEWTDALDALIYQLPGIAAGKRKVRNAVEAWRKKNRIH